MKLKNFPVVLFVGAGTLALAMAKAPIPRIVDVGAVEMADRTRVDALTCGCS